MSALVLKAIALAAMTLDHIGYFFGGIWLRVIGRIAFPIYCFLIANGAKRSKNRVKYAARLLVFALLSEPFYDRGFYGSWFYPEAQNVLFTLFTGLVCLLALEKCAEMKRGGRIFFSVLTVSGGLLLAQALGFEYGWFGVSTVLLYAAFPVEEDGNGMLPLLYSLIGLFLLRFAFCPLRLLVQNLFALDLHALPVIGGFFPETVGSWDLVQIFSLFAVFPISFYNGEKGTVFGKEQPSWMKYLFYVYYPAHIILLSLLPF